MSVYLRQTKSNKKRGWKYDFTLRGRRHTSKYYKTKAEAKRAEAQKKEELNNPKPKVHALTDMAFLDLVNARLDYVKAYNSERHYMDYVYMAKRWIRRWGKLKCSEIYEDLIQEFIFIRNKVSADTANKEIRYLRATFNFGKKKRLIQENPTEGIEFLPVEKRLRYIPPAEDIEKVISVADKDTQDYLYSITDTMARMSEINRLTWDDVNLKNKYLILYTRKKKGGHFTPRKVPLTARLYEILQRRYSQRDKNKPWVFWHSYWSSKTGEKKEGPYKDRKKIMSTLCQKAEVRYFRFHALRHASASILDSNNVPIGSIQRLLGHENRTTTEIYLHSLNNSERDAITVLESTFR